MFTGIVENTAEVIEIIIEGSNLIFLMKSKLASELKIDQSLSHNGVCLTVTDVKANTYRVTAVDETLQKTTIKHWRVGSKVNIERCMPVSGRFDGHIVQGHVDEVGICTHIKELDGSWLFDFRYVNTSTNMTVEKGSICINGVSLTVFNSESHSFRVTIIPYTYQFTNFHQMSVNDSVNLEFDILGKYIQKILNKNVTLQET